MNHIVTFICITVFTLPSIIVAAPNLSEISAALKKVDYLKAEVTQKNFESKHLIKTTEGTFTIHKPDKLRFEIMKPEDDRSVLVANKSEIKQFNPGLDESLPGTLTVFDTQKNPAKIWFSLFDGNFSQFSVSGTDNLVVLSPKASFSDVEKVEVVVDPKTKLFKVLTLYYRLGTKSEFTFKSYDQSGPKGDDFEIKAPKNTIIQRR